MAVRIVARCRRAINPNLDQRPGLARLASARVRGESYRVPGIGVVTNPRSRMNKRDPASMRKLGYLIGSRGSAEATRDLDDLYRVAEEFKRAEIDILGINGGDGTIHHTLTAFVKTYGEQPLPAVAILRGGTMNTIANSYGIKGDPARLLFEVVDKYHNNEPFDMLEKEILAVGDAYGCIFGTGIIYNFLEAYYGTGNPSPSVAAKLILRAVASALVGGPLVRRMTRRFRARVTVDGDTWARDDFLSVAAACVEQIGLGFRPFYRWQQQSAFQILGIHAPSALGFISELPRIHRGRPMRRDKVIDAVAREVVFENDGPIEYIIDGDSYTADRRLRLGLGPKLRFLRPNLPAPVLTAPASPPALPAPST
jgi:diacylglycerol kinase family enzyme